MFIKKVLFASACVALMASCSKKADNAENGGVVEGEEIEVIEGVVPAADEAAATTNDALDQAKDAASSAVNNAVDQAKAAATDATKNAVNNAVNNAQNAVNNAMSK